MLSSKPAFHCRTWLFLLLLQLVIHSIVVSRCAAQSAPNEKRFALLVGIADYHSPSLPRLDNPCADVDAVHDELLLAGWSSSEITARCDLSLTDFDGYIRTFVSTFHANEGSFGLFYFAGHGVVVGKDTYLFAVNAKPDIQAATRSYSEDSSRILFQADAVNFNQDVLSRLGRVFEGGVVVILDACRNNALPSRLEIRGRPFASLPGRQLRVPGVVVATSAQDGKVAYDGFDANSPYAISLCSAMRAHPCENVETILAYAIDDLTKRTADTPYEQVPFKDGSLRPPPPTLARCTSDGVVDLAPEAIAAPVMESEPEDVERLAVAHAGSRNDADTTQIPVPSPVDLSDAMRNAGGVLEARGDESSRDILTTLEASTERDAARAAAARHSDAGRSARRAREPSAAPVRPSEPTAPRSFADVIPETNVDLIFPSLEGLSQHGRDLIDRVHRMIDELAVAGANPANLATRSRIGAVRMRELPLHLFKAASVDSAASIRLEYGLGDEPTGRVVASLFEHLPADTPITQRGEQTTHYLTVFVDPRPRVLLHYTNASEEARASRIAATAVQDLIDFNVSAIASRAHEGGPFSTYFRVCCETDRLLAVKVRERLGAALGAPNGDIVTLQGTEPVSESNVVDIWFGREPDTTSDSE